MPLLQSLFQSNSQPKIDNSNSPRPAYPSSYGEPTIAGERVSVASSMSLATFYRGKNIISDDVGKMPLQQFLRTGDDIQKVDANSIIRNMAYLLQVSPNAWNWTPFHFKKAIIDWQICYGNAYIWRPPVSPAQLLILPANRTRPVFDLDGNLWYEHYFSNSKGKPSYIPDVEILQLLINPDETGMIGRGVITFARETIGQRLGARKTQSKLYSNGLNASAYIQMDAKLSPADRDLIRTEYGKSMSGSDNAYSLAVFDKAVTKFEPINLAPKDAQFLESIDASDTDIANFLGMPLHMLNRGKESYNSNEQKYIEYLQGTLDAYLVPFEEGARIKWLSERDQTSNYFKFNRASLLRMDAKTRAETNSIRIQSGQMKLNEARVLEELSPDPDPNADKLWMMASVQPIDNTNNQPKGAPNANP